MNSAGFSTSFLTAPPDSTTTPKRDGSSTLETASMLRRSPRRAERSAVKRVSASTTRVGPSSVFGSAMATAEASPSRLVCSTAKVSKE